MPEPGTFDEMLERATPTQPSPDNAWMLASKIAIQIVENTTVLDDPRIVCQACGCTLTTLADMDTVASLLTLAMEHTCFQEGWQRE